ncbi:MAG: hypothetical protein FWC41_06080 [Firmicutes bacterium]|nr:hypothetical protein [Bacillota bacterium]
MEKKSAIISKNGLTDLKKTELEVKYNRKKKSKIQIGMKIKKKKLCNFLFKEDAIFESFLSSGDGVKKRICDKKQRMNVPQST